MLIEPDASKYFFVAQGMLTIDNVDDAEEMKMTDEAFDVLNFSLLDGDNFLLRIFEASFMTYF